MLPAGGRAVERAVVREGAGVGEGVDVRLVRLQVVAAEVTSAFTGVTLCVLRPSLTQRTVVPAIDVQRREG